METAHNGIFFQGELCPIIHRDLKPTNIFILEEETGKEQIKVLDFGIAKIAHTQENITEHFMGTPRYCSPEQLQGLELDNRSDIYSLGVVLYEMLTKRLPWLLENGTVGDWFNAHIKTTPDDFDSKLNIPVELQELVMSCLAKSPSERPQSAGEIAQKLDSIARKLKIEFDTYVSSDRSSVIINDYQRQNQPQESLSDLEKFYLKSQWPINKPQDKIVFPRITPYKNQFAVSLWTMLDLKDIFRRKNNTRYNQFVFQSFPHPMILWISVLYSTEDGARWLPCYLDLKTKIGEQVTNVLSDSKEYHLLFFPLDQPEKCQDLVSFKIMLKQRTNLKQWASISSLLNLPDQNQAIASKRKLKQDFELMKPKIILEIQKSQTQEIHG
jgi:serine/threonine-protein kinase